MKRRKRYKSRKNDTPLEMYLSSAIALYVFCKSKDFKIAIITFIVTMVALLLTRLFIFKFKKYKLKQKYINSGIGIVDKMTGEEFEEFLLAHFYNLGYKGELTKKTNDYGADLILRKDGEIIVVQAKRWVNKVGIEAIQQIIGAKEYYKATKCMVICNNYYTPNAINLAVSSNVELWDRKKLLEVMNNANGKEILEEHFKVNKIEHRHLCKKCGSVMALKKGEYGEFYGCSNYPKCRYTEKNYGSEVTE